MTDFRGVITDGNAVFARVSGYGLSDMMGANHNIIRHPAMPRAVFQLLWSTLKQGRTFTGYVLNLAANGNHYWVFATVMPVEGGYLSVRIKPHSERIAVVQQLYAMVLAMENELVANGASERVAAEQGLVAMLQHVQRSGWSDYDVFSNESLIVEIKQRDRAIAQRGLYLFPSDLPSSASQDLCRMHALTGATYEQLNLIFGELDEFLEGSQTVARHEQAIASIGDAFQINALNAHLAAHPLGSAGVVIGTVAGFLNDHARQLSRNMRTLTQHLKGTVAAVSDVASNVCVARVQMEMILSFLAEMAAAEARGPDTRSRVRSLHQACHRTTQAAANAIDAMLESLPLLRDDRDQLEKDIVALHTAQVTGITEAARLGQAAALQAMFADMRRQVEHTRHELDALGVGIAKLMRLTRHLPHAIDSLLAALVALKPAVD